MNEIGELHQFPKSSLKHLLFCGWYAYCGYGQDADNGIEYVCCEALPLWLVFCALLMMDLVIASEVVADCSYLFLDM